MRPGSRLGAVAGCGPGWMLAMGEGSEVVVVAAGDVGEAAADVEGAVGRGRQGGDFAAWVRVGLVGGEGASVGSEGGQADVPLEPEEVAADVDGVASGAQGLDGAERRAVVGCQGRSAPDRVVTAARSIRGWPA